MLCKLTRAMIPTVIDAPSVMCSCYVHVHAVEPPITDPPTRGQPLYNGH